MRALRFAFFLTIVSSGSLVKADTPAVTSEDEWYIIELQDMPCGYMHSTQKQVGEEVRTRMLLDVGISRGETKVKITADQNYRETVDGRPLGFEHKMSLGQMPVTQKGTVQNNKLTLVTTQEGASSKKVYPFDPEVKFAWGLLLEQRKRGIKPGTSFSIKTYDPSFSIDSAVQMDIKVHDKEQINVRGKKQSLFKLVSTLVSKQMEVPTTSWVDADATPIVMDMNLGFLKMRMLQSTKEEALKLNGASPEMFFSTLVKVDKKVPKDAREVTLRLTVPTGNEKLPDIPNTGMQTFERKSDYEGILTIHRLDWNKIRSSAQTSADSKMAAFLQASPTVDINDKRIKLLARRGTKGANTPAEKADSLRKFVTDYISDKSLDVGFATASEVARTKAGDCSEHGVLLAALARAAGLPSRGVSGIVQVPWDSLPVEAENAFGYHMWTQVYIGGQWVDIDGALRQTDCDPTHIALSLMPLNDEGLIESVASLLPLMGRLKIEVLRVSK